MGAPQNARSASYVGSRVEGATDVRTGDPGGTGWVVSSHAVYGGDVAGGAAHYLSHAAVSFRYVAGFTPQPGAPPPPAANVSLHALDAANGTSLGVLWASGPLGNYSFDRYVGYSPPITGSADGLRLPNARPITLALQVHNNNAGNNNETKEMPTV